MAEAKINKIEREHVLKIYHRRAEHVAQFSSPHAKQMHEALINLCDALSKDANENVWFSAFYIEEGKECITVFDEPKTKVLGSWVVVNKTEVSEEFWEQLWGKA